MTQNEMILAYLEKYGSITQAEAMASIGCYRLGARIWELKRRGVKIKRYMEEGLEPIWNTHKVRTLYHSEGKRWSITRFITIIPQSDF